MDMVAFLFKWFHLLFGITWVGLLFYFNFVQAEFFKKASPETLADAKVNLTPKALAWFRWAALATFATGFVLFGVMGPKHVTNDYIVVGAVLGTLMFLNVWLIIWPKQKVVLGLVEGDIAAAGAKAALASRTNVLFSAAMVFCMLASPHLGYTQEHLLSGGGLSLGLWLSLGVIAIAQLNAMFGKMLRPLATIRGVIHLSLALAVVIYCLLSYL